MKTETTYFKVAEKKSAHPRPRRYRTFELVKKPHGYRMGVIKYFNSWRQWCFFADPDQAFNSDALRLVADYMENLNEGSRDPV